MSGDLSIHAPSVPVQPVATRDTSGATTKVNLLTDVGFFFSHIETFHFIRTTSGSMNTVYHVYQQQE